MENKWKIKGNNEKLMKIIKIVETLEINHQTHQKTHKSLFFLFLFFLFSTYTSAWPCRFAAGKKQLLHLSLLAQVTFRAAYTFAVSKEKLENN